MVYLSGLRYPIMCAIFRSYRIESTNLLSDKIIIYGRTTHTSLIALEPEV